MPKKEKIFPINTVGGRIQSLRHNANLSRSKLYDRVFPGSPVWSATNKDKTVYNWESGKTELDYENMIAVCNALNCSSDYLLGLDECTNKTNQFIHDQIGISEDSIDMMSRFAEDDDWTLSMDFLLESTDFIVYFVPSIYQLAFCTFTYIYASLLDRKVSESEMESEKESAGLFNDILYKYLEASKIHALDINDSLTRITDSLCDKASKMATHAINSPSGSKMFEEVVEKFKRDPTTTTTIYPNLKAGEKKDRDEQ